MTAMNIIAVYPDRTTAERARERLVETGVGDDRIRLSAAASGQGYDRSASDSSSTNGGWLDWLFGADFNDEDRDLYGRRLTGERTAVSVLADETRLDAIEGVLDELAPVDLREEPTGATVAGDGASMTTAGTGRTDARADGAEEEVIPVVEENVDIGKRTVERRHRIRTRVIEEPIEKAINLRDERVVVERRPVDGDAPAGALSQAGERDVEIVERHEEPVVDKSARKVEEVVVRKEQGEHTETVHDKVRRTEVDTDGHRERSGGEAGRPTRPKGL